MMVFFGLLLSVAGLVATVFVVYWIWIIQERLGRMAQDLGEIKEILRQQRQ